MVESADDLLRVLRRLSFDLAFADIARMRKNVERELVPLLAWRAECEGTSAADKDNVVVFCSLSFCFDFFVLKMALLNGPEFWIFEMGLGTRTF